MLCTTNYVIQIYDLNLVFKREKFDSFQWYEVILWPIVHICGAVEIQPDIGLTGAMLFSFGV
jgi:hypothetical protein